MFTYLKEARTTLSLMLPILASQLAQMGMGTVDTIVAGHYSTLDLASVSVGNSIWIPIWMLMTGVLIALSPLTSKMTGANQHHELRHLLHSALQIGLGLSIAVSVLMIVIAFELDRVIDDPAMAKITSDYLMAVALGMPGSGYFLAYRFYAEATDRAADATKVMVFGVLLNIPVSWLLANGIEGVLPPLGGLGCGIGTSVVFYAMSKGMSYLTLKHDPELRAPSVLSLISKRYDHSRTILKVGLPIGLSIFFEVTLFAVISLFLVRLGQISVSAHQVAINLSSLTFMLPLSMSMALTIRVGRHLGTDTPSNAGKSALLGIGINTLISFFTASFLVLFASDLTALYSPDTLVVEQAAYLLLFAGAFQISDAIQVGGAGALRGYQDTIPVMIITFLCYWPIGFGTGYVMAFCPPFGIEPMGAAGFWVGLISGLSVAAVALSIRLRAVIKQHALPA